MAKILEQFAFSQRGQSSHRYNQFFDGQIWKIDKEKDFPAAKTIRSLAGAMQATLRRISADKRRIRCNVVDDKYLVVQAYDYYEKESAPPEDASL